MKAKCLAVLLMIVPLFFIASVGAQEFHTLEGNSVSVTSEAGAWPQETVLHDATFDAQNTPVSIEGSIFDLYVASGSWPDTAYLEIGVRPEATKEQTNAGVYMIVFASSQSGILAIHLQDYGGQRPPCPPWPAYMDAEKAKEGIDYRIILVPHKDSLGGIAYLELWDVDGTHYEAPSQEYGYSSKAMADANTLDEDFSTAYLFYSIMGDAGGEPDITYSATVSDIKTNIMTTELLEEQIQQKDKEIADKQSQIDELNRLRSTDASSISRLQDEKNELKGELNYWMSLSMTYPAPIGGIGEDEGQIMFACGFAVIGIEVMVIVKKFTGGRSNKRFRETQVKKLKQLKKL